MTKPYITTIGLEIHAELKTQTKMFCDSKNDTDEKRPNVNICPICLGHPGTLPVINKEAVRHVLKVGLAVGGEVADFTEFDRKNYFYPDIPKGYQISQYKYPLIKGGNLNGVDLTRIHLEEDTAKSTHDGHDGESLIDFNRAGIPLMELVTEPTIHSAKEAGDFARELQLLLRYLDVSDANMEKGEMRVEANISVSQKSKVESGKLGTKVEVKNLNSFKAVENAIAYEVDRHIVLLEKGEKVVQETRGWDEHTNKTFSQRLKEDSHDYRYFPDPDLPKLYLSRMKDLSKEEILAELPELPWQRRERYQREFDLKQTDVEQLVSNLNLASFFENIASKSKDSEIIKLSANYLLSDVVGLSKKDDSLNALSLGLAKITPQSFLSLILMIHSDVLSSRAGKDILARLYKSGGDPKTIAETEGLIQSHDAGELKEIVSKIISENPKVVAEYQSGKISAMQFLIGQGMKLSKGKGNPKVLAGLFVEMLKDAQIG